MNIRALLKDTKIIGIHCSKCDFLIEAAMGEPVNDDFFQAAAMHHAKFHEGEVGDDKTNYDIRATKKIFVAPTVSSINLTVKQ